MVKRGLKAESHPLLRMGDRVRIGTARLELSKGFSFSRFYRLILSVEHLAARPRPRLKIADVGRVQGQTSSVIFPPQSTNITVNS